MGNVLGQLLAAAGNTAEAREVLQASLAAATKIGLADLAEHTDRLLHELPDGDTT